MAGATIPVLDLDPRTRVSTDGRQWIVEIATGPHWNARHFCCERASLERVIRESGIPATDEALRTLRQWPDGIVDFLPRRIPDRTPPPAKALRKSPEAQHQK